jgi:HAE1 family hydrophobic/amphiphilic exporter-1
MATTLSLLAVFLPVGFMGGIVGRFMSSFGFTSAFAIAVSLLVSFTLTPMLVVRASSKPPPSMASGLIRPKNRFFHWIDVFYTRMLKWAMAHRGWMLASAAHHPQHRAALHVRRQELPAGRRSVAVQRAGAHARRHLARRHHRKFTERIAHEIRQLPGVDHTLMTAGGGRQIGQQFHLREAHRHRQALGRRQMMQRPASC